MYLSEKKSWLALHITFNREEFEINIHLRNVLRGNKQKKGLSTKRGDFSAYNLNSTSKYAGKEIIRMQKRLDGSERC